MRPGYANIEDLIFFPKNPKQHDLGAIHTSINQFGFLERVIINEITGHILAGAGRVETLLQKKCANELLPDGIMERDGKWFTPVDYVSVPEDKEGAVVIALNRTTELGGWDNERLVTLLQEIAVDRDALLASTGYDGDDIDKLLRDLNGYPDLDLSVEEHWEGLPEFVPGEKISKIYLIVHFETEQDRDKFGNILGLILTEKTKSVWYPEQDKKDISSIRFDVEDTDA
jgi:hypothetical protein